MTRLLLLATLTLPLAACEKPKEASSVSFNLGDTAGSLDSKSGEVKLDIPGFQGAIKLPKIKVNADDFDMNGVHLYPGSTIEGVDVAGDANHAGGVRVSFTSPADAGTVRDWFRGRLTDAGFTVSATGTNLTGTTEEKKPFRLDLTPASPGRTRGTVVIGG